MSDVKDCYKVELTDFQKAVDAVDMSSDRMQRALKENELLSEMAKGFDSSCPTCGAEDFEQDNKVDQSIPF